MIQACALQAAATGRSTAAGPRHPTSGRDCVAGSGAARSSSARLGDQTHCCCHSATESCGSGETDSQTL